MKKLLSILLALTLALALCACAEKTAGGAPGTAASAAPTTPASGENGAAGTAPAAPEPSWRYALGTEISGAGEIKSDDGVLLATQVYELPCLNAACDGDAAGKTAPEEMRKVCDAFNGGVRDYTNEDVWGTLWDIKHEAKDIYRSCLEDGRDFMPLADELSISDTRQEGSLVSVRALAYINLGGAHPDWGYFGWNFDLQTGTFFKLSDLTDRPAEMHRLFSHAIVRELADSELFEAYYDDFYATVDEREDYNVFFGADGAVIWFDEYELGPHIAGVPEVTIPYGEFARFLNERGRRLLALSQEDKILGDYYEAEEMRYWFEGDSSIASETGEAKTVHVDGENGGWDLWYYHVDRPGLNTLAALRATLEKRFAGAFVDGLLESGEGYPVFREFDGALYMLAAGRGADVTVASVDYTVELNADKTGGRVVGVIHRQDYDETKMDWVLTGETDTVAFPFELTADGARFTDFPCIY